MTHPLDIPPKFKKVVAKKERSLVAAIMECIYKLAEDPKHPGLKVHPVRGTKGIWEAYVDIHNRVTFEWAGDTIVMRANCNHDIINRSP